MGTLLDTVVQFPGVEAVPGLNLGVAAVESYNSIHNLKQHHPIVAATSAGNAAGSLGTFLAQVSMGSALMGSQSAMLLGAGSVLGAIGGGLGIGAGVAEIRKGREIREATGSSRTLMMGYLDIASGVTSLSGAAAMATGAGPLGISLMMLANLVDLTGIGVDYLWKKSEQQSEKQSEQQSEKQSEKPPADGAKAS